MELKRFEKDYYKISPRIDLAMSLSDREELQIRDFIYDNNQILQFEYVESKEAYLIRRFDQISNIQKGIGAVLTSFMFGNGNLVILSQETRQDNQLWVPTFIENGYVVISTLANPELALTVTNYTDLTGTHHVVNLQPLLEVNDSEESKKQQFKIDKIDLFKIAESDELDSIDFIMRSPNNNSVYTFVSESNFDMSLYELPYQNISLQHFKFIYDKDKKAYQIHSESDTDVVLTFDLQRYGVGMLPNDNSDGQYWVLKRVSDNKYMIRSKPYINQVLKGFSNMSIAEQDFRENKQRIYLEKIN